MACYNDTNSDQMKMIPVSFESQRLPGSFEYFLSYLIDQELDLTAFDNQYRNDDSGYYNREMLEYLESKGIDAYLADTGFRSRDPRFMDHKESPERNKRKDKQRSSRQEFTIDKKRETCRCPAGHAMW